MENKLVDENVKNSLKVVVEYMTDEWLKYMNPQTIIYKSVLLEKLLNYPS